MSGREDRPGGELLDLPLRDGAGEAISLPLPTEGPSVEPSVPRPAPPSARVLAAGADGATVILLIALAVLSAGAVRDRWPTLPGVLWAAGFGVYLSFFAAVVPLVLFGRTVGMALAGLSAGPAALGGSRRLALREAVLRWLGTALTAASLGLSLLFTARDHDAPTLADGLSGRPLFRSESASEAP